MKKLGEFIKIIKQKIVKFIKFIKSKLSKINKHYIYILIATIVIFAPYISANFVKGDDFICHISELFAIDDYLSIENLRLLPSKIRTVICNNLGYGDGIFYPQFSYYVTIFINIFMKRLGFSIIESIKVFEFLLMFFSGIFMYKFINITFKSKNSALAASIMYIAMPYFCEDIFDRIAYGEMAVFLFIPIVFLAVSYLLNKDYKKFMVCFVIGYSGMIFSHLVVTIFLTVLVLLVLVINIKEIFNKKSILYLILSSILVLGITSPFWIPLMEHKIQGDYVVFSGEMATDKGLNDNKLSFYSIISDDGVYAVTNIHTYINIVVLVFDGIVVFNLKKIVNDKIERKMVYSLLAFSIASIIIGVCIPWDRVPDILNVLQFPWRMSTFIAFGASAIAGLGIKYINPQIRTVALIVVCVVCLNDAIGVVHENYFEHRSELLSSCYTYNVISGFETSGTMGWKNEYLPVNAKNNIEYIEERNQDVIIVDGIGNVEVLENSTPYMKFYVYSENDKITLELPRLYYLGYTIKVEREDGTIEKIEYYENENGLIEIEFNGTGTITVEYDGTTLNKIANVICIVSIIFIIFWCKKREKQS